MAKRKSPPQPVPMTVDDGNGNDVLWGADEIGAFLGRSERQIYHMARAKLLPITKCGKLLIARKSELRAATSANA